MRALGFPYVITFHRVQVAAVARSKYCRGFMEQSEDVFSLKVVWSLGLIVHDVHSPLGIDSRRYRPVPQQGRVFDPKHTIIN